MTREELHDQIVEELKAKGKLTKIGGIFGEWENSDGLVQEVIRPEEGGTFTKVFGSTYLFKGHPTNTQVVGLEFAKACFSAIPREILASSFFLSAGILGLILFTRKRFIRILDLLAWEIHWKVVRHYDIEPKEYNKTAKELRRALDLAIGREYGIDTTKTLKTPDLIAWTPEEGGYALLRLTRFFCLFIELDSAYRFRLQDALGEGKDFRGTLDILMQRETAMGIGGKWKFIGKTLPYALLLYPRFKRVIDTFFRELNRDEVRMDEADWYYCLKYRSYNFGGKSEAERLSLRAQIDEEKGHITDYM